MSETVLVALITFASGLGGAVVGAFATYMVSSLGVKAERGKLLHNEKMEKYSEAVSAYNELVRIYAEIKAGLSKMDVERIANSAARFFDVYSAATLLASPKVQKALEGIGVEVTTMAKTGKPPKDTEIFDALMDAMREDLLAFGYKAAKR